MLSSKIRGARSLRLISFMFGLSALAACGGGGGDSGGNNGNNNNNQVSCADGVAFVALESSHGYIATSPDGECWNERVASAFRSDGASAYQIAYDGTSYYVTGFDRLANNSAYLKASTTLSGSDWGNVISGPPLSSFKTIAYQDSGVYVLSGDNVGIYTKSGTGDWTQVTNQTVVEPGGSHIGTGATGVFFNPETNRFSLDSGDTWQNMTVGPASVQGNSCLGYPFASAYRYNIDTTSHTYLTVRCNGVMRSSDASNWQLIGNTNFTQLNDIAYGDGMFVAVGEGSGNGEIWVSDDDGANWTDVTPANMTSWFRAVTYGHGKFVATTVTAGVYTSTDGINWTQHNAGNYTDVITIQ